MRALLISLLLTLGLAAVQAGVVEPRSFDDPADEARYRQLIQELRCLVCQNQNLADSNADLAKDLRDQTYNMIKAGKTDEEIVAFMVNRYGDFVLYRPPLKSTTVLLWLGPLVLIIIGMLILFVQVRRRAAARQEAKDLTPEEQRRIEQILADTGEDHRS